MVTTETAQEVSRLLTNSRLKTARRCQREHLLQYELGYRPVIDAEALRFGSLFHAALEAWTLAIQQGRDPLLTALTVLAASEADPFDRVKAECLISGYHFRWQNEPYDVLAVEKEFETELRNPETSQASRTWRLGGKVDAIVRNRADGRVFLMEHKTSAEDITQGSEYWRRLRMDGQISIYFDGAKSLGFDVSACLYDVIGKPGLRPLKATPMESRKFKANGELYANQRANDETPEEYRARLLEAIAENPAKYYQRGEVVRLEAEMDESHFDIWQTAKQIREAELAHRAPRNPDACMRFGRLCPFFSVCSGEGSLDNPAHFTRNSNVHPELDSKEEPH